MIQFNAVYKRYTFDSKTQIKLKVNEWKVIYPSNQPKEKWIGYTDIKQNRLIKAKIVTREKGYFVMIKRSIHRDNKYEHIRI